jgi:hypothetical protein
MAEVHQPVNDNTLTVRQLTHYQFTYVPGDPGDDGIFTLQLVLDQGAWEEVLTVEAEDAEALQGLLRHAKAAFYDVQHRSLIFGTTKVGE